ncbi:MAG: L-threonylcarbamoyladenylate synthase [Candidatus Moraniibacteriota bacterium]|jgi:L-threonylcarbamoyladenylate synthase
MPEILTQKNLLAKKAQVIKDIKEGKLFIYPTDTLHGLGTNAQNKKSVEKIIDLKRRSGKAFLITAPSLEWIFDNCVITNKEIEKLLTEKLPGPYSFILKLKNAKAVSPLAVNFSKTIGVRLPNNWFSQIIAESGVPFISTSINYAGEPSAKHLFDIPQELRDSMDYIIWDEASSTGKASTIIDVTSGIPKILRP